jgi:ligand-binding sensor domain-containing protein
VYIGRKVGSSNYVDKSAMTPSALLSNSFTTLNSTSFGSPVSDIFVSGSTIFVATLGSGIYYADITTSTPSWTQISTGLVSNQVKNIYVNSSGNIYVTYASGNASDNNKISKIIIGATPPVSTYGGSSIGGAIQKFYVDPNGSVFVTTDNGGIKRWASLSVLDSNATPSSISIGTFTTPPVINDIFVKNVSLSQHIVVATNKGLFMSLNGGVTWSQKTIANGLPSNNIKKVYIDDSDDIYVLAAGTDNASGGGLGTTNY